MNDVHPSFATAAFSDILISKPSLCYDMEDHGPVQSALRFATVAVVISLSHTSANTDQPVPVSKQSIHVAPSMDSWITYSTTREGKGRPPLSKILRHCHRIVHKGRNGRALRAASLG